MRRRNEVAVGITVILAIVLLVVGTMWMQGLKLGAEETIVQARFQEVGQILRGNSVKLRGVPIGRVETIELEEGGRAAIVTMSINSEIRLPEDPAVILSPESMLGDWQAQIVPRASFPQYRYTEAPDPKVLPGYALPDISQLTAVADQIAGNLAQLTDRFEIAFTEQTAQNVARAIQNIQEVSQQLNRIIEEQNRNADEVAEELKSTSESLGQAAEAARRVFAQIDTATAGGRVSAIMTGLQNTTARADSLSALVLQASDKVRSTAISADSALRSISAIAQSLQRGEGTLGLLLRDSTLYYRLNETNAEVQLLLRDLRANPRKYINLTIF